MKAIFSEFLLAADELDELSLDGYFGEDIKKLVENRDSIEVNSHLYESLKIWIEDDAQVDKEKVKEFILIFFDLYLDAYKIGGQESVDIMSAFWMGTHDNPELEYMSAYTEFSRLFTETKLLSKETKHPKLADRKKIAHSYAGTYSKGVEFIGKTLTTCIILNKIASQEPYNYYKIYNMTIFEKVKLFTSDGNTNYNKLTKIINRNLRNAEAHLSLNYDAKNNVYLLKKKSNGKIITDRITMEQMITELFIGVGLYTQAFVYSGILFVLAHDDKRLFTKSVKEIYG